MRIPMSSPDLTDADIAAINEVLQTCYLSIGPQIEAFEKTFSFYVGTEHAEDVCLYGAACAEPHCRKAGIHRRSVGEDRI
jgi:dTDP-4-amino-4,6-dideoxygalactose transaminase